MRRLRALLAAFLLCPPLSAGAEICAGQNLIDMLSPADLAELDARVAGAPYHEGNFWRAEKGDQSLIILGTYHLPDPRHALTLKAFAPDIDKAAELLVESTPEDQDHLQSELASDPFLIAAPTGPTLAERMTASDWERTAAALEARGVPAIMGSRLQPWYVSMMLGFSPCMLKEMQAKNAASGADQMLMAHAESAGVPVRALEPWNTILTVFDAMTPEEELDMLRSVLPAAERADDYAQTLADTYFAGDVLRLWEFTRLDAYATLDQSKEEVDAQMEKGQDILIENRNRRWIPVIKAATAAAARKGKGVVVACGALHLPGEVGLLNLLAEDGWALSPLPSPFQGADAGNPPTVE